MCKHNCAVRYTVTKIALMDMGDVVPYEVTIEANCSSCDEHLVTESYKCG